MRPSKIENAPPKNAPTGTIQAKSGALISKHPAAKPSEENTPIKPNRSLTAFPLASILHSSAMVRGQLCRILSHVLQTNSPQLRERSSICRPGRPLNILHLPRSTPIP